MSAPTMLDPVVAYAAAVRSLLADLGPEVLDDLTGGLEADLAESVADALDGAAPTDADLVGRFGSAQTYAAELRESAGLPPVGAPAARPSPVAQVREAARRLGRTLDDAPGWPRVRATLVALRSLWWILRGWTLAVVVAIPLNGLSHSSTFDTLAPQHFFAWVVIIACVVVSIELGRGAWVFRGRLGTAWRVLAVLLVPCSVVVMLTASDAMNRAASDRWWAAQQGAAQTAADAAFGNDTNGVMVGGQRATNLFVYGPDGELVDGAQVLDQAGRPVVLGLSTNQWGSDGGVAYSPRIDETGRPVPNAFPVPEWTWSGNMFEADDEGRPVIPEGESATTPRPPALSLLPLWSPAGEGATTPDDATSEGAAPGDADDESSSDAPSEKPSDAPADKPSDKASDAPSSKASEKPSSKPSDTSTKSSD